MTLRHTENNVTTTAEANKFLQLTTDNTLPVLDASAVTGLPNVEPLTKYVNQSTINLQYNEVTMIDNFNFGATTINISSNANTGDKIIIAVTRAGANNITINLPANHKMNYKGTEYINNFVIDTYLIANLISKSNAKHHGLVLLQFIAYNDSTNINWLHYTASTSLEEYEPTLYNNLLDYQTIGCLGTDLNLYAVSPSISYYKVPSSYASTTYTIASQTEYINSYNKSRFVLIVDNANITTIDIPTSFGSDNAHFTIIKTNLATQNININVPNVAYPWHSSNTSFVTATRSYTLTGTKSITILSSIYWTVYYVIITGES
ncbi:hypothetical protein UFOVP724_108 [uncultured Caudovirales phage]|uniref:Uncharacterized protein n=1 Tax=uncultured Caudovirales phage TaxID=2100421 RepID=A0A6J5NK33_9CAUD|nr:hypothetical protein UFOVP724_108 [uncultured Caudovirales phage]